MKYKSSSKQNNPPFYGKKIYLIAKEGSNIIFM